MTTDSRSAPKTHVAVLFGGPGSEYDISCASAVSIVRYLDRARYEVTPIRITPDGYWAIGKDDPSISVLDVPTLLELTPSPESPTERNLVAGVETLVDVDVAFPAFHGRYGEDGTIQGLFDLIGVPYVGNGIAASASGMDKSWTKALLRGAGLTVTGGLVLHGGTDDAYEVSESDRAAIGLPAFVKPAREGSSVGITRIDDWDQLAGAIATARSNDDKVLLEPAVIGREIDVAVLELADGRLECGPPLEIVVPNGDWFDYDAKYITGGALRFPDDLEPAVVELLHDQARRVFRTLSCSGLLRVDFFVRTVDGEVEPVINEVNTFPGFSSKSQVPSIWARAGIEFPRLLDILIQTALTGPRPE
jgi:D-alanine-D-alanine ligase